MIPSKPAKPSPCPASESDLAGASDYLERIAEAVRANQRARLARLEEIAARRKASRTGAHDDHKSE